MQQRFQAGVACIARHQLLNLLAHLFNLSPVSPQNRIADAPGFGAKLFRFSAANICFIPDNHGRTRVTLLLQVLSDQCHDLTPQARVPRIKRVGHRV